jgi:leader peptidase (prepilin peptidase) / N-methyltransferase
VHGTSVGSIRNDMIADEVTFGVPARLAAVGATLAFAVTAVPALAAHGLPDSANLAISAGLGAALVGLSCFDLTDFRLPDALTMPLLAAGLLVEMRLPPHLLDAVLGAVAGYGLLWLVATVYHRIRGHAGLGLGDAKLMAAAGAWLGIEALPTVLLVASLLGLGGAVLLQVCGTKLSARTRLAFGPYLALSFWLVWLYGAWFS